MPANLRDLWKKRRSVNAIVPETVSEPNSDRLVYHIDRCWSNDTAIGIQGWIFSKQERLDTVELQVGETRVAIDTWFPRPDVAAAFPEYQAYNQNCGFSVVVPRIDKHQVNFVSASGNATVEIDSKPLKTPVKFAADRHLWQDFLQENSAVKTDSDYYITIVPKTDDRLVCHIDTCWSNDSAIGIRGWIFSKQERLDTVELQVGETRVAIDTWFPRPDVAAKFPEYKQYNQNCGFSVLVPRLTKHYLSFVAKTDSDTAIAAVEIDSQPPKIPIKFALDRHLWQNSLQNGDRAKADSDYYMTVVPKADDRLVYDIENCWSNDTAIGLQGWIFSKQERLDKVELQVGETQVAIESWSPRPDIAAKFPEYQEYNQNCGFSVVVPRIAKHHLTFIAKSAKDSAIASIQIDGQTPPPPLEIPSGQNAWNEFVQRTNNRQFDVLEIGSRVVSPGSQSKRSLFPKCPSYTGFDYYGDENTDVVGDAHKLSSYFGDRRFGAIFSVSVLEHLAMPWLVAREVSKLLEIGGLTFHSTHFSFPLHETPWDFWRFSDAGLKALFSPALGFEIVEAGLFNPVRMHLDRIVSGQEMFPLSPGFASVSILAKKVSEPDFDRFQWDVDITEAIGSESHYPAKNDQTSPS